MGKKQAKRVGDVPAGQLADWGDDIPEEVRELAELYDKTHLAKSKASGKFNTAKDRLIAAMKEAGIPRCPVRNGSKTLAAYETDGIKYEKPAEPAESEE